MTVSVFILVHNCRHGSLCLPYDIKNVVRFSSVQNRYLCDLESPYVLHLISQKFPQYCLWNGSNFVILNGINCLHVGVQLWTLLAMPFQVMLLSWRRSMGTTWCRRNSWTLPSTTSSRQGACDSCWLSPFSPLLQYTRYIKLFYPVDFIFLFDFYSTSK